jgi:hypothetical protein
MVRTLQLSFTRPRVERRQVVFTAVIATEIRLKIGPHSITLFGCGKLLLELECSTGLAKRKVEHQAQGKMSLTLEPMSFLSQRSKGISLALLIRLLSL